MSRTLLFITILQVSSLTIVHSAKQQLSLSDSYLPVAMQVIAHLTDQMSYATQADEPAKPKPPVPKPSQNKPATPLKPTASPFKPMDTPVKPASFPKPTTQKPYVTSSIYGPSGFNADGGGWSLSISTARYESTTQHHRPGLYAPVAPPKPNERVVTKDFLLPIDQNSQYTVIAPNDRPTEEPLLSIEDTEIKPLLEPKPDNEPLLPPHFAPSSRTSEDILLDDEGLNDEGLQYLSPTVRELIKMANDPDDERLLEVRVGDVKAGPTKMSSSSLRLLLLYDLLSRDAKKQRLNDYSGFSDTVIREMGTSSSGGAASQLAFALKKMLDRQDCTHEYANNRAREMITELGMNESKLSSEVRNLQPLIYKL